MIAEFVSGLGIQPGDLDRVIGHWTGGGPYPTDHDKKAYHALIDQDLRLHRGTFSVDDNIDTSDKIYAAHTLHANTKAFGLSLCGMANARENPLDFGPSPLTEAQFKMSAEVVAYLLRAAALPCEPHTALTHAEVQATLGITQRGKWDISVLSWRSDIRGAQAVGDYWRSLIRDQMGKMAPIQLLASDPVTTLRMGNKTPLPTVRLLQNALTAHGYTNGTADGIFGPRTRAAVLAFQADNGLEADGVVGARTWEMITVAAPRPERQVTEENLREDGSRTIANADQTQNGAVAVAGIGTVMTLVNSTGESLKSAEGWLEVAQRVMLTYWPVLVFLGLGAALWHFAAKIKEARVSDAVSGANDRR